MSQLPWYAMKLLQIQWLWEGHIQQFRQAGEEEEQGTIVCEFAFVGENSLHIREEEMMRHRHTCSFNPALMIGSATWATALATRRHVETTPTTGAKGRIFFTNPGKNLFVVIPIAIGAKTTFGRTQKKGELM